MMAVLAAVIIAAAALAAVAYPLLRQARPARPHPTVGPSRLQELLDRREALGAAMRDLEMDRGLGNIDEAEYRSLRADYEGQAVAVLKALDARASGLAEEVEKMVQAAKAQRARGEPLGRGTHCARCGAPRGIEVAACAACGFPGEPRAA